MARKIGIMGVGQNTGQPRTYVKKSVALLLVRRNLAEWVISNLVLRMRHELSPAKAADCQPEPRKYIPEKLPANIDYQLGLKLQIPSLAGQVRFRAIADQRSNPAY